MHWKSGFFTEDNPPKVRGGVLCKGRFREEQIAEPEESGAGRIREIMPEARVQNVCFYRQLEEQHQQLTPDATYRSRAGTSEG
jgi:hypothetical protein